MLIDHGSSVRSFFHNDLKKYEHCTVLLPEWICFCMSEEVLRITDSCFWYPVQSYERAKIPMETDWEELAQMVLRAKPSARHPVMLLLAHPLGFIDPGMFSFLKKIQAVSHVYCYLDFAQSYGKYDFTMYLPYIKAMYFSFNGNKLLTHGGAVRISSSDSTVASESLITLQAQIADALAEQDLSLAKTLDTIKERFDQNNSFLSLCLRRFDIPSLRSNKYRTVCEIGQQTFMYSDLQREGYGQTVHPDPQKGLNKMSSAYQSWMETVILIFSKKRTPQ